MDNELYAISPLDGRYRSKIESLSESMSEAALIRNRIKIEAGWLLHLCEISPIRDELSMSSEVHSELVRLSRDPPYDGIRRVKEFERQINHDVKAVEYFMRERLKRIGAPDMVLSFIHFACTSEDVNNLSYALMLEEARKNHLLPEMEKIIQEIALKVRQNLKVSMLARTHGQPASPTTLGKEFSVFGYRLLKQKKRLSSLRLEGKMNGAVGNYNAHVSSYQSLDWLNITRTFIEEKLGLVQNPLTTQIENHDCMIEYLDIVRHFNVILLGFCRDIWTYISMGYFKQVAKKYEVGSSTMPHKVNPIDFENAEGNLGIAVSLAQHFSEKLPISRLQRDLSDSTVQRVLGAMIGHTLLGYKSVLRGISKISANHEVISEDLENSWVVLAEAIQTVMRRYGIVSAYEKLKNATRSKYVDRENLHEVIKNCTELPAETKEYLLALTPSSYIGRSVELSEIFLEMVRR
ncbi:MAG: adenylosuccinate lyase [Oligoflexales bacterium]|nr:adenylosuccinate lyase [Oligoflexales bacterium]